MWCICSYESVNVKGMGVNNYHVRLLPIFTVLGEHVVFYYSMIDLFSSTKLMKYAVSLIETSFDNDDRIEIDQNTSDQSID